MNKKFAWAIATSLTLAAVSTAQAQVAEVPDADSNGNFNTAIVQGNRGFYTNDHWVVVAESSDDPLNCRYSPNGEIRAQILPGAIVAAAFRGPVNLDNGLRANYANDAIVMHNGQPWLRLTGYAQDLVYPVNRQDFTSLGECYVRANLQYITPLNNQAAIQ